MWRHTENAFSTYFMKTKKHKYKWICPGKTNISFGFKRLVSGRYGIPSPWINATGHRVHSPLRTHVTGIYAKLCAYLRSHVV